MTVIPVTVATATKALLTSVKDNDTLEFQGDWPARWGTSLITGKGVTLDFRKATKLAYMEFGGPEGGAPLESPRAIGGNFVLAGDNAGLGFARCRNLTVEGLRVQGATGVGYGLALADCDGAIVRDFVADLVRGGLKATRVSNFDFYDLVTSRVGADGVFMAACHHGKLRRFSHYATEVVGDSHADAGQCANPVPGTEMCHDILFETIRVVGPTQGLLIKKGENFTFRDVDVTSSFPIGIGAYNSPGVVMEDCHVRALPTSKNQVRIDVTGSAVTWLGDNTAGALHDGTYTVYSARPSALADPRVAELEAALTAANQKTADAKAATEVLRLRMSAIAAMAAP